VARLRRFLSDHADIEVVGECGNGKDAVEAIRKEAPDLVFLDIQMPEMTGFEAIAELNGREMPTVIFVTAYDQYALQAFEVHALDYLLKPFSRERLGRAVERAREHIKNRQRGDLDERLNSLLKDLKAERKYLERLVVKTVGRVYFITGRRDRLGRGGGQLFEAACRARYAYDPRDDELDRGEASTPRSSCAYIARRS
jgi:two-component system, LytTR family, response regulator